MSAAIIWNYKALLDEGIRLIEAFSSRHWTDYNVHDPGITTLEFLCYALTDIAGRVGLPLESHLAEKVGERVRLRTDFFEAHEILPCGPVTLNDYRRLLIDIPGIRNAWLHPVAGAHPPIYALAREDRLSFEGREDERLRVRGFYDVEIEFDKTVAAPRKAPLKEEVRRILMTNRNLCEDFQRIEEIGLEEVSVCIDVELALDADVNQVKAEMLYAIDEFVAPSLRRFTLQEMLDDGYRIEEVLNGPLPQHGFVKDEDLQRSHQREALHGSDLIQILLDIPAIVAVRRLLFTTYRDGKVVVRDENAVVPLAADRATRFDPDNSRFRFFKAEIPYITNPAAVEQHLARVRTRHRQAPITVADLRPELPAPVYVEFGRYTSIQHHFPTNYMLGAEGVSPLKTARHRAAVKQFKGFLLLFEQLLADFHGQIRHAVNLLSPLPIDHSYAHVPPTDVPRRDELVRNPDQIAGYYEDPETFHQRRNQFLDHLLARYAEQYREYSMLVESAQGREALPLLITDKERLLDNLAQLSFGRFQAYDYSLQDAARSASGLERRLRILLGYTSRIQAYTSEIDVAAILEKHFEPEAVDLDGLPGFHFRIADAAGKVLLQGTRWRETPEALRQEMQTALFAGTHPGNYKVSETADGWQCTLNDEKGDILGTCVQNVGRRGDALAARDECVAFLGRLFPEDEIFVLEHVLLRPPSFGDESDQANYRPQHDDWYLLPTCFDEDDSDCCAGDAYSSRITVVMPAWPERFRDMNFRNFLARFIREQTPAHIFAKICWISMEQMNAFQPVYRTWRKLLAARDELVSPGVYLTALEQMIDIWRRLRSVYPAVHLFDCTDVKDITPTVLGDSTLGQMNGADDEQD